MIFLRVPPSVLALGLACLLGCAHRPAQEPEARILKVLPSLLDSEGRASIHPSLYERDAYQALLRKESARVGGIRFDILWKASSVPATRSPVVLKLELRGSSRDATGKSGDIVVVERPIPSSHAGRAWSRIVLGPDEFRRVGEVSAWRATLLREDRVVATTQSFLW